MYLAKTDSGQSVLTDRSIPLNPRQRTALIMFDGKKSVDQVLASISVMGGSMADIDQLVALGLVVAVAPPPKAPSFQSARSLPSSQLPSNSRSAASSQSFQNSRSFPPSQPFQPSRTFESTQPFMASVQGTLSSSTPRVARVEPTPIERYQAAYQIATKLTSGLGLRGFRLNMAVEGAKSLDDLKALAPKILAAVGEEAYLPLEQAMYE